MSSEIKQKDFLKSNGRQRLQPIDPKRDFSPWRKAEWFGACSVYWMPTDEVPIPAKKRRWLLEFLNRFTSEVKQKHKLRCEQFIQFKTIHKHCQDAFVEKSVNFMPMAGLSRRPGGADLTMRLPDDQHIQDLQQGRSKFEFSNYIGDYSYWFISKDSGKQREAFFGFGGMSILFLPPNPGMSVPLKLPKFIKNHPSMQPLLRQFDVEALLSNTEQYLDPFLEKSKEVFGVGLEHHPQYKGFAYIIPLLKSQDLFSHGHEEIERWFSAFDIYLRECEDDGGLLLASKFDLDECLSDVITAMQQDSRQSESP